MSDNCEVWMSSPEKGTLNEQIAAWETAVTAASTQVATLRLMRDRFPDAEDRGRYSTPRWWSRSAHEVADRLDMDALLALSRSSAKYARPVLYAAFSTSLGEARVYSSRPVDLSAMEEFIAGGCTGNLIEMLKATTLQAEKALKEAEDQEKAEEQRRAEEKLAREARKDQEEAKPVKVVGPVTVANLPGATT